MELPVWQNLVLPSASFASSFSEAHSKCSAFSVSNSAVYSCGLGAGELRSLLLAACARSPRRASTIARQ